ncbi:MAG: nickel-dependent hydrogenase large subunit [Epsilonproteobacteria bacterium]|nr:nickel-dependent hydrogenase large subunit [Campylobacterota bacterium]
MKITKEIIEKIEGEAKLELEWKKGKVVSSKVKFFSYRGLEEIIEGRHPMDALVLTPRVCGICGHAQLMACVHTLENLYENCGVKLHLSDKAKNIRDITLDAEIIQNHIKWLYFIILPILYRIDGKEFEKQKIFKALNVAVTATKLIAVFAGQWPHNSYMIPGGVVCDPTYVEIHQAKSLIKGIISFFEKEIVKTKLGNCTEVDNFKEILDCGGVMSEVYDILDRNDISEVGKAHDRFIAFGENSIFKSAKAIRTITRAVHSRYIQEESLDFTYAKNVKYNGKFYEVGPLARAMVAKNPLAKSIHRVYKDSLLSRIVLKIMEIAYLSKHIEKKLNEIDLNEESYIKPKVKIESLEGKGEGFAEAARGSLYHSIEVENGKIKSYDIITPTQWNLGNSVDKGELSTIQQALLGLDNEDVVSLVFRSFDECSVCTTH